MPPLLVIMQCNIQTALSPHLQISMWLLVLKLCAVPLLLLLIQVIIILPLVIKHYGITPQEAKIYPMVFGHFIRTPSETVILPMVLVHFITMLLGILIPPTD